VSDFSPPWRLQGGTSWPESTTFINDNFQYTADNFQGLSVEDQLAFPFNSGTITLSSGQLGVASSPVISGVQDADVTVFFPRLSVYVDPPDPSSTGYSDDYLLPVGSALTLGQKAVLVSQYRAKTAVVDTTYSFTGTDGALYWYIGDVVFVIRNVDGSTHNYALTLNQSVYNYKNSFYR
jgi:hypothetical protein